MDGHEGPEGFPGDERHVAAEDQDIPVALRQEPGGAGHGMAGSELFLLENDGDQVVPGKPVPHPVGLVPHDEGDPLRPQGPGRGHRVGNHRLPFQQVHHLHQFRFHPGPLAGSQDQRRSCHSELLPDKYL